MATLPLTGEYEAANKRSSPLEWTWPLIVDVHRVDVGFRMAGIGDVYSSEGVGNLRAKG